MISWPPYTFILHGPFFSVYMLAVMTFVLSEHLPWTCWCRGTHTLELAEQSMVERRLHVLSGRAGSL